MKNILSDNDRERIRTAIAAAELKSSGEIRVHLDRKCGGEPMERATELFHEMKMHETRDGTGVLLYIAWESRRLAVIGDHGIHAKVDDGYWNGVVDLIIPHFKDGRFADGVIAAVEEIGRRLAAHFPRRSGDKNELADEVTEC